MRQNFLTQAAPGCGPLCADGLVWWKAPGSSGVATRLFICQKRQCILNFSFGRLSGNAWRTDWGRGSQGGRGRERAGIETPKKSRSGFPCSLFPVEAGWRKHIRKDSPVRCQRRSENGALNRIKSAACLPFALLHTFNLNVFPRTWGRYPETGSVPPNGPLCIPPVAPRHRASALVGSGQSSRDECPQ